MSTDASHVPDATRGAPGAPADSASPPAPRGAPASLEAGGPSVAPRPAGLHGAASLWSLSRLRLRAALRHHARQLRRPRRLVLTLAGLGLLALMVAVQLGAHGRQTSPPEMPLYVGSALATFLGFVVWQAVRHGSLHFSPEEIHFLFPAPISSRALLLMHLVTRLVRSVAVALVIAPLARPPGVRPLPAMAGYALVLALLAALGLCVETSQIGVPAARRRRRAALLGAGLLLVAGCALGAAWWHDGAALSPRALRYLAAPLRPVADLLLGQRLGDHLPALVGLSALVAGLAALTLRGTIDIRESAHASSARVEQRLAALRTGRLGGAPPRTTSGRLLPRPPRLGGAGPHLWRQLTALSRSRRPLVTLLLFSVYMGLVIGFATGSRLDTAGALQTVAGVTAGWIALVGPVYVQADFRSDYELIPWLRTLPTPPFALAAGQLSASAVALTLVELLLSGWVVLVPGAPLLPWCALLALLPVVNLVVLSVWNGAFLLYPVRIVGSGRFMGPGQILRMYLVFIAVMAVSAFTLGLAAGGGLLARWGVAAATGSELAGTVIGVACGLAVLLGVAAACVWSVGRLFARVDPSRDLGG